MRYHVEIPPLQLQEKYQKIVDNIQQKVNQGIIESNKLVELRDWLLPMFMNGQVVVNTKVEADLTTASVYKHPELSLFAAGE